MNVSKLGMIGVAALCVSGCVSYTGIPTATDDMVDEANQPYAAAAQKEFDERKECDPAPVEIVEDKMIAVFLNQNPSSKYVICNDPQVRKELVLAFKTQLRDKVSGLREFKLLADAQSPLISVGLPPPGEQPYRMVYNIISVEMSENAGGTLALNAAIGSKGGAASDAVIYKALAKVEIKLFNPANEVVFSFLGDGSDSSLSTDGPNKDMLMKAVREAANNAISGYVVKFGPPIYVTDTCQGGQFAKLSVGSDFGLEAGQTIEFYRNSVRKSATGAEETRQIVVGSGEVGAGKSPVEPDGAWVKVNDFDPTARAVFRFTSARVMSVKK